MILRIVTYCFYLWNFMPLYDGLRGWVGRSSSNGQLHASLFLIFTSAVRSTYLPVHFFDARHPIIHFSSVWNSLSNEVLTSCDWSQEHWYVFMLIEAYQSRIYFIIIVFLLGFTEVLMSS